MAQTDWAKIYAAMDQRITLKYEQLPRGEQIGKRPQSFDEGPGGHRGSSKFHDADARPRRL